MREYFVEYPDKKSGWPPAIKVRKATQEELTLGKERYLSGNCEHSCVYDTPGFDYDLRCCAFCDKFITLI